MKKTIVFITVLLALGFFVPASYAQAADTTPPTAPTNLTATPLSSSQINLSWTASTDTGGSGLTGYKIYRCTGSGCTPTIQIATSTITSYSDTGLMASTAYTYAVSAYDAAGNESAQSTSASATTQAPSDTTMPTISNISGTVAQGQTLTIAGSNMVNEDKTKWDSYFTKWPNSYGFEGSSPTADGYCYIMGNCPSTGVYDTSVKLIGNQSMKFHVQGASYDATNVLTSYNAITSDYPAYGDLWIRFYARWNLISGGWPTGPIKMLYNLHNYYIQPCSNANGSLPSCMYMKVGSISYTTPIPSGQLQNNKWYLFEVHWKTDATPYVFDAWMDGVQIFQHNPTIQDDLSYVLFGIINTFGTNINFSLDHWWDGFAVSSSRIHSASLVEIGDSPDYLTATKVYQEPVFISDTTNQIKLNLTGLGNGPYYLWVTNNRQLRSAAFQIDSVPLLGDVTCNKEVDVLDVQALVNCILGTGACDWGCGNSADVNNDTAVDILDVQEVVNVILGV